MTTGISEFRRGWHSVALAALGCGTGVSGLFTYNAGLFLRPLQRDIGLTNTQFGACFLATTVILALTLPVAGGQIDRGHVRRTVALSAVALAASFVALGVLVDRPLVYFLLMGVLGAAGAATTPLAYNRLIGRLFVRQRGLALGIAQTGIGVSAAAVPPMVGIVMQAEGWRAGYFLLGGIAAVGALVAWQAFPAGREERDVSRPVEPVQAAHPFRSRLFWHSTATFSLMALGFFGPMAHFVPILIGKGMDARAAALYLGLIGVSTIASRIVIGWLIDKVAPSTLMAIVCLVCAGLSLALVFLGVPFAVPAAIGFGVAIGAEADVLSFVCLRYFGVAAFGRVYGIQFGAFLVSAGLSPLWLGYILDLTGNYAIPITVSAAALTIAAVAFIRLPWNGLPLPRT